MFKRGSKLSLFELLQVMADILIVNLSFYLAYMIRFNFNPAPHNIAPYIQLIPFISITTVLVFNIFNLYSAKSKLMLETVYSIILSLLILEVLTMASTFFIRGFSFPRSIFFIAFVLQIIFTAILRYIVVKVYRRIHGRKNLLIIGNKEQVEAITRKIFTYNRELYYVKYICTAYRDEIKQYINDVDVVVICSGVNNEQKSNIVMYCIDSNKELYIIPELFEITMLNSQIEQFDDIPVFKIENLRLTLEQRFVKRCFDILLASVGIILFLPLMCIIALFIKVSSPGPVLYIQDRLTMNNKVFKLYKLRTMIPDAEKGTGPVLASEQDSRITKIGKFLRMTRLDELPQLFNVLRGDMSIVGPRPERPYFADKFKKEIPGYEYRLVVKAGITGLAQVLGKYTTNARDKLIYDLLYIRNYSLLLDFKLILQTFKVILLKDSSKGVDDERNLENVLKSLNYNVFNELGVTRIEKF